MKLSFTPLDGPYAITRLPADAAIPDWADGDGLVSITRADDELSIVCAAVRAPETADTGWSALRVDTLAALETGCGSGRGCPHFESGPRRFRDFDTPARLPSCAHNRDCARSHGIGRRRTRVELSGEAAQSVRCLGP